MMTCLKNPLQWPCKLKLKCLALLTLFLLMLFSRRALDMFSRSQKPTEFEFQDVKYTLLKKYPSVLEERLIHFDLKGAPPKIEYLLELMSFVKNSGGTGILIEYEDMFPYKDDLEGISALNAYTLSDVAEIEETAKINNLSIIPYIPTFGNLEFVLKLDKFKHFREMDTNPEILCPSRSGIYAILQGMIDQVLQVHKNSKYVHIGCDLVQQQFLGVCAECQNNMKTNNLKKNDILLEHIRKLAKYIGDTHPGVRAIVWGNDFIKHTRHSLSANKIPDLVDIMLWNYDVNDNHFPSVRDIKFISKVFPHVWVAGSYKGTTGPFKILPEIDIHLTNSRFWKRFMEEWKNEIAFKGVVLMGRQRYTHFEVLTELLPVSVPSMTLNLQPFQEVLDFDYDMLRQSLVCSDFVPLNPTLFNNLEQLDALHCDFPGFEAYRVIFHFFISAVLITPLLHNQNARHFAFYNILHREGRPLYVRNFSLPEYETHLRKVKKLEGAIEAALTKFYDNHTVNEWIMTYVIPLWMNLQVELTTLNALVNTRVWPRRPLVNDIPHFKAIFNNICPENDSVSCSFALLPKFSRLNTAVKVFSTFSLAND